MNKHARRGTVSAKNLVFLAIIAVGVASVFYLGGRGATGNAERSNALFQASANFELAKAAAATEGKLVFVLATADWCPPCRSFRGGTLADPTVQQQIADVAVPYKLDVTNQNLPAHDAQLAQMLGVSSIPAVYAIDSNNNVLASAVGDLSPNQLTSWLNDAASQQ
ncbi:MAG: thioredoxin fold domain-containing protein [Planctomycetota bacterium]